MEGFFIAPDIILKKQILRKPNTSRYLPITNDQLPHTGISFGIQREINVMKTHLYAFSERVGLFRLLVSLLILIAASGITYRLINQYL
jgi:hypothetical protein